MWRIIPSRNSCKRDGGVTGRDLIVEKLPVKHMINLAVARCIAAAAEAEASANDWAVVISIVDDGGHLVLLQRMDGTQLASIDFATQKALSALIYRRPTKAF